MEILSNEEFKEYESIYNKQARKEKKGYSIDVMIDRKLKGTYNSIDNGTRQYTKELMQKTSSYFQYEFYKMARKYISKEKIDKRMNEIVIKLENEYRDRMEKMIDEFNSDLQEYKEFLINNIKN